MSAAPEMRPLQIHPADVFVIPDLKEPKMRKSIAAAVIAASAMTGACGQSNAGNGGPTVSRNYQVGNFQQIEVAGPYDVQVRTGANPTVSARGGEKLLERTVVEVQGDKLLIHPQEHHGWFNFSFGSHGKTVFTVTVPQLSAATLAGAGDLNVDAVHGDRFEAKLAGAGDLSIGSVDVQALKLSMAGSGDAKVGSGRAQSADYSVVGTGDIDARGLVAQQLKVSIAGAGDVKAHATGAADVNIMGAGDVEVSGGAKCTVNKSGAGDVRCS
jgi:Putative auto-transporter adhesin, head GIN domain